MIPGVKQQENQRKGELRTENILLNNFWVMQRNVDIDGADFFVQPRAVFVHRTTHVVEIHKNPHQSFVYMRNCSVIVVL